jgi:hypothetical protein
MLSKYNLFSYQSFKELAVPAVALANKAYFINGLPAFA